MRKIVIVGTALGALVVAGCGDSTSESETAAAEPTTVAVRTTATQAQEPRPKPKPKPAPSASYRDAVTDCVEEVAYVTRDAGNALRVESPGGRLIANIQTFGSPGEAAKFNAAVEADHASGGRGVAIFLRDAGDDDRSVVTDCLTP